MVMLKKYKTVKGPAEFEIIEKKSRFIANVMPVETEKQAEEFLDAMSKKYYDARHNVFAWRISDNDIRRMSDDGEPSGTGGLPVLDVLMGENLTNICVNVTRYFGGTLLGTGGLIRAYGGAAKGGVIKAGIVLKVLHEHIYIETDYNMSGKIQYEAVAGGHLVNDTVYTENVRFDILAESERADPFIKHITDITGGRAVIEKGGTVYI